MNGGKEPLKIKSPREILLEFAELRAKLDEAEQTLDAIRSGDVDALVVYGEHGERVYTLKGADEPYRIFVEQMNEGALTLTADGTILYCNQSFATMAGLPTEKVVGSSAQHLLFGPDGSSVEHFMELAGTERSREEMIVLSPSGETPVLLSGSKMEDEGAEIFAFTVTDLSVQRKQESQLRKANEELEAFSYSVSHDLRAPLRNIISSARILLEDVGPNLEKQAQVDLASIAGAASHLGKLIDDLLSYSRLTRYPLKVEPVDVSLLARWVSADYDSHHEGPREWQINDGIELRGDARLIQLVLDNLMSNAAKYSGKGASPRIEVGSIPWENDIAVYVKDNGIGFEMTYAERIFQPFERLHRQSDYPGTGIGLASASRIVTRHGGAIWAESSPGHGASFYFTIPAGGAAVERDPDTVRWRADEVDLAEGHSASHV